VPRANAFNVARDMNTKRRLCDGGHTRDPRQFTWHSQSIHVTDLGVQAEASCVLCVCVQDKDARQSCATDVFVCSLRTVSAYGIAWKSEKIVRISEWFSAWNFVKCYVRNSIHCRQCWSFYLLHPRSAWNELVKGDAMFVGLFFAFPWRFV
jgi:hypothetical protein